MFCNVFLEGTTIGSATDENGMYIIHSVNSGDYTLTATYIGYDTIQQKISLKNNQIINKNLEITKKSINLTEIKVSAEREAMRTEVKVGAIKVTKKDLKLIPTIGGQPDLAQYMQIIPGVVFTGDQGGQLYIRGGSPTQNKVLLDGMTIYSPFHSIGLFSVFDSDIISNIDVYTGGFNAEHGGRISSIMDVKTIDGNKKRLSGKIATNTLNAKIFLEGPLAKNEQASFIFSGKTSYLDKTSKPIYNQDLPYSYTDLYTKISLYGTRSKFNAFGFHFEDNVNYKGTANLGWKSNGIGGEFVLIPSNLIMTIEGNFAYSKYAINFKDNFGKEKSSLITGYGVGFDFTYFYKNSQIRYGLDVHALTTSLSTFNTLNIPINQNENSSEVSGYVNYKYKATRFILEPGLRVQRYSSGTSFEPRLGIKYIVTEYLRFKVASGMYSQNILSTVSDRDVVNLFTGIITSPDCPECDKASNKFQTARHLVGGFEYDVSNNIDFQIEGYIKDFTQLTNRNRNKISESDPDWIIETGKASGVDALIKYNTQSLYIWCVYSLGFVTRDDGGITYSPHFDRRHNINLVASYSFGKNNSWKIDTRWNLGSGLPFTQTQGFYEDLGSIFTNLQGNGINTDYTTANGDLGIHYGDLNKGRLPYYHRLDLAISKIIKLSRSSNIEINGSVTNLYNRENIFYINRITQESIYQLPIMPSLGATFKF